MLCFLKMVLQDASLPSSRLAGFLNKVAFLAPAPCHLTCWLSCGEQSEVSLMTPGGGLPTSGHPQSGGSGLDPGGSQGVLGLCRSFWALVSQPRSIPGPSSLASRGCDSSAS